MFKTATLAFFLVIVNFTYSWSNLRDSFLIQLKSGKDFIKKYSALLSFFYATKQSEANTGEYVDLLSHYHRNYCLVDSVFYYYQNAPKVFRKQGNLTLLAAAHISLEDMNNNNGGFLEALNAERDIYERLYIKHGISTYVTHLVNPWQHERRLLKWCNFAFLFILDSAA